MHPFEYHISTTAKCNMGTCTWAAYWLNLIDMSHFSYSCKTKEKNEICRSISTRAVKCDGVFFVLQHGFQYGFQHA